MSSTTEASVYKICPSPRISTGSDTDAEATGRLDEDQEAAGRTGAVLTFGGEQVVLPFVEHDQESQAPALTLDLLTEAFAHLGEGEQDGAGSASAPAALRSPEVSAPRVGTDSPAGVADAGADDAAPRSRRGRRNRSASRAQGAANETTVEHREVSAPVSAVAVHEAKAPAAAAVKAAGNEPIILGVGVPASEL